MKIEEILQQMIGQLAGYLPNLIGGIILIAIGWLGGWLTKRVVVQVLSMLKLGRQLRSFRWARDLGKADVRLSVYGLLGNIGFLVVFLIFVNAAFTVMKLAVLSALAEKAVFLFPRLLAALVIFGVGWLLSLWVSVSIHRGLLKERVPRAALVAGFGRAMSLLFFAALALLELDIAREVVIIGFTVTYVTLGAIVVIAAALGGKSVVQKLLGASKEE